MLVDPNKFFKKLTLSICSSLDLNVAMKRSLNYLRQIFPVEEIMMTVHDSRQGSVRVVSRATIDGSKPTSETLNLPEGFWEWIKRHAPASPTIMTETLMRSLPREYLRYLPHQRHPASEIVVPLVLEKIKLGVLLICAPEGLTYQQEHLDLIVSVREPFAVALSNAIAYHQLLQYRDTLIDDKDFLQKELTIDHQVIGELNGLKEVMNQANHVAKLNNTVLITGETGVGKEVVANAIHKRSSRRHGPFIKVNCGAIAESLIDSELFGYEKGAFTGATSQRRGRFERANGGTIFLDEVGELSPNAQVRLLRVLATHEIERVGGTKVIPVDIRVITATHRHLEQMVAEGQFREDLWFRLNVFPINVPPLREHKSDIAALFRHFLTIKSRELGISPPALAPGGLTRLMDYDWPGNVRELENVVERELIRAPYSDLLFESLHSHAPSRAAAPSQPGQGPAALPSLDEVMKSHIQKTLRQTKGKINGPGGAAEVLKINPNTLRSRMDKYNIHYGR